jgi:putative SOS response-associated peptidase YedK
MCGRFTLKESVDTLASLFDITPPPDLHDRFNIAPTQGIAAIRQSSSGQGRELAQMRWGLIPAWAKDPASLPLLINARAETAATKPAFRAALRYRRCLVPASGFYEWQRLGREKRPFHIRMKDAAPFAMAGLWEHWVGPDGSEIDTCALLTIESNEIMRSVHDRMPVILSPDTYDLWLDPDVQDVEIIRPLLRSYPSEAMVAFPVTPHVNNARNDDPQCLLPLE